MPNLESSQRFCQDCGSLKNHKFCNSCKKETKNKYNIELSVIAVSDAWQKNLMRSNKIVDGKPKKELKQFVGNKDKNVVSEIEVNREKGKQTIVTHRLWRKSGKIFLKVHEHEK